LETNRTPECLILSNNEYDSASAKLLYEALEKNVSLKLLKISKKDKIYTEFGERFEDIQQRKSFLLLFDKSQI